MHDQSPFFSDTTPLASSLLYFSAHLGHRGPFIVASARTGRRFSAKLTFRFDNRFQNTLPFRYHSPDSRYRVSGTPNLLELSDRNIKVREYFLLLLHLLTPLPKNISRSSLFMLLNALQGAILCFPDNTNAAILILYYLLNCNSLASCQLTAPNPFCHLTFSPQRYPGSIFPLHILTLAPSDRRRL